MSCQEKPWLVGPAPAMVAFDMTLTKLQEVNVGFKSTYDVVFIRLLTGCVFTFDDSSIPGHGQREVPVERSKSDQLRTVSDTDVMVLCTEA